MSIESAKAFIDRMKTDEDFAKKTSALKDKEERMMFVKGEGYDFNVNEVLQVNRSLSDDELEGVGGGSMRALVWFKCDITGHNQGR